MKSKQIYFDNGATTKVDPKVLKAMMPYFTEKYGNASSIHSLGQEAKEALENAREVIAKSINAKPKEIIFTSGGTESNNFAIQEIAYTNVNRGNHIITTKVEHKSIINICKFLEKNGFEVTYLDVDKEGFVNPDELEKAINDKTILVSIIHGNNEIGTIQDLEVLGKICKKHKVYFHTDACQSFTKTEIDVQKQNLDLATLNSHKIHGPKGVGALYIKDGTEINPLQFGGGHEFGLRGGTENIHGIVGFAESVKLGLDKEHREYMKKLRDKLIENIVKIKDTRLNGPEDDKRLCNNANFSFMGIEGESIVGYLDMEGICASTGSACSEKSLEPNYVLKAIGLSNEEANGSLRIVLSRFTTDDEIDYLLKVLPGIIKKLREMSPFAR